MSLFEYQFKNNPSVINAEYLGRRFRIPQYPWEALTIDQWTLIASAISKVLYYQRFSPEIAKDHKLWKEGKMGDEAFAFATLLVSDRGFARAVKEFNAQVSDLKYGDWLEAFNSGDKQQFFEHMAQIGQLIYNSVKFLKDTGYLLVYGNQVTKVLRPYWAAPAQWAIDRDTATRIIMFVKQYYKQNKKHPALRKIAAELGIARYTLIEIGFTRDVIRESYIHYRKTGETKIIKPTKEYKRLTEEEQKKMAQQIARRVFMP